MPATLQRNPTNKQIALIQRLANERGSTYDTNVARALSTREASAVIAGFLATPARNIFLRSTPRIADEVLALGMYRTSDGTLYKVQKSKASDRRYAKKLVAINGERLSENDAVVQWEFVYDMGAIRRLQSSDRLTLDEARAFGLRYGVCCVCGATLKDATSVANGIGPVCARNV